jgi:hypothetical protein
MEFLILFQRLLCSKGWKDKRWNCERVCSCPAGACDVVQEQDCLNLTSVIKAIASM